ncbi:hypothetical protein SLH49_16170 [Cognatiyoonia sp. IB215446]|uniref:hypothetical protein n=1 Tax=Cognatiyoonia sp. IB215446 TaxID=3097355 RepID=UPI002A0D7B53|nr:hypothetical protein [Cognatiyoonia sp. IB215446]MDX8349520.1 hypothetical protein [Cognatiyoonia sp. IB215446]
MRGIKDRIWEQLPNVKMPTLGKNIDIPVYVIHNSADPEDYFFIFDFEQFVERSRSGMFVRPRLKVWAGRNDFGRSAFARQFRESFAAEFDAARQALAAGGGKKNGWFSWSLGKELLGGALSGFVANLVLLVAMSAGKLVWSALPLPGFLREKSDGEKLENSIAETQGKVDQALAGMKVTLHRELYEHARKFGPVSQRDMDCDAWPLPDFVAQHLNNGTSTSWW